MMEDYTAAAAAAAAAAKAAAASTAPAATTGAVGEQMPPPGPLGSLALRLAIGGPRQLRRSGAVYVCTPGRVYVQWQERWLLLDGFMLKCFSSCNSLKPKTTIPLESAVVEGKLYSGV